MSNKGKKNPNFKDGHTMIQHYCIDCGDKIGYQAIRCRECANKQLSERMKGESNSNFGNHKLAGKNHPSYVDERHKKYYCIEPDCNNQICYENWNYGNKRCQSCAKSGKFHPNWKEGISPLGSLIRSMKEYKNWRNLIFKRDNYTCQECGDNKGHNLNTHHKNPFAKLLQEFLKEYDQFSPIEDKETLVRLAIKWQPFWKIDNGTTLCEDCHKKEHLNFNKVKPKKKEK